jgi:hypothetical protein
MNELIEKIKAMAETQDQLAQQAVLQYKPIVAKYLKSNCTDSNQIAYTLDFMLDFCFDAQMLNLYRKLCRHVYSYDQETAVQYVQAYRERWDEEGKQFGNDEK